MCFVFFSEELWVISVFITVITVSVKMQHLSKLNRTGLVVVPKIWGRPLFLLYCLFCFLVRFKCR